MRSVMTIKFDPGDVGEFLSELRSQPSYPKVIGDPLLLLYDLLTLLNVPEKAIANWFGPRGYMYVARHRTVFPVMAESDEEEESESE